MTEEKKPGPPDYAGLTKPQIFKAWHREPMFWREIYTRAVAAIMAIAVATVFAGAFGYLDGDQVTSGFRVMAMVIVGLFTLLCAFAVVLSVRDGKGSVARTGLVITVLAGGLTNLLYWLG